MAAFDTDTDMEGLEQWAGVTLPGLTEVGMPPNWKGKRF